MKLRNTSVFPILLVLILILSSIGLLLHIRLYRTEPFYDSLSTLDYPYGFISDSSTPRKIIPLTFGIMQNGSDTSFGPFIQKRISTWGYYVGLEGLFAKRVSTYYTPNVNWKTTLVGNTFLTVRKGFTVYGYSLNSSNKTLVFERPPIIQVNDMSTHYDGPLDMYPFNQTTWEVLLVVPTLAGLPPPAIQLG